LEQSVYRTGYVACADQTGDVRVEADRQTAHGLGVAGEQVVGSDPFAVPDNRFVGIFLLERCGQAGPELGTSRQPAAKRAEDTR